MKTGAFILSIGQETARQSIDSVAVQVDDYIVVENISPVNKAINVCFELAAAYEWEWFIILGADTIHKPSSIETMMKYTRPDAWCVYGRLEDYYRGDENYGNHLYNLKAVKDYRVKEDDPMYDHKIHADMDKNWIKVLTEEVIGTHHPIWTPKEAFMKHYFSGIRYDLKYKVKYYKQVCDRYKENDHPVNLASKMGFEEGMKAQGVILRTKEDPDIWDRFKDKFNEKDKLVWKNLK